MTIISNIIGGLGNQMFQYAAGHTLSKKTGQDFKLDLKDYEFLNDRNFELEATFNLKTPLADDKEIKKILGNKGQLYIRRVLNKVGLSKTLLLEKPYELNKHFFEVVNSTYLDGYWQNYNYFKNENKTIKKLFNFSCLTKKDIKNFFKKNKDRKSVSVHIRKGDYINKNNNAKIFFALGNTYYKEAFKIMKLKVDNPYFYIFSDDIEWVKGNLDFEDLDYEIVKTNLIIGKDMALMKSCHHHIIANSTYSWWAAWLNSSKDKIVIAPKVWLNKQKQPDGLNLPSWIKI